VTFLILPRFCTPNQMFQPPPQNRHPACPGVPWESL